VTATDVSSNADSIVTGEIADFEVHSGGGGVPTIALVQAGWTSAQQYANSAFVASQTFLASLGTIGDQLTAIPVVDANLADITTGLNALTTFSDSPPTYTPVLSFTDADYTSPEMVHLLANLDTWVQGASTGLSPAVEQAIWDRGRAREAVSAAKKSMEAFRQFASRGFSKPPGALAVQLMDAAQEAQDADISLSRDVMIKQADLEQSNRHFAFERAAALQQSLMVYMQDKMRRTLEVQTRLLQALGDAFGVRMQGYSAQSQYRGTLATAQGGLIRASADVAIAEGNIRIEAAKANIQALIQKATVLAEALRAGAQVSSQVAAASLAAVNLSAGMNYSASDSISISDARSRSVSAAIGSQSNRQENYTP
jgi:hypothetical protein